MDEYEKIVEKFLADMARVKAPNEVYIRALNDAIDEIRMRIDAAERSD